MEFEHSCIDSGSVGRLFNKFEYTVFNDTEHEIVERRNGGMNIVHPAREKVYYDNQIKIVVKISVPVPGCVEFAPLPASERSELDNAIIAAFEQDKKKNDYQWCKKGNYCLDVTVTGRVTVGRQSGEIRSDILGFVITYKPAKIEKETFLTDSVAELRHALTQVNNNGEGLNIQTFLVDGERKMPKLFTSLYGHVQSVPVVDLKGFGDGLYMRIGGKDIKTKSYAIPVSELSNEKLNAFAVYKSHEEALRGDNSKFIQGLESKVSKLSESNSKLRKENEILESKERVGKTVQQLKDEVSKLERQKLKLDEEKRRFEESRQKEDSGISLLKKTFKVVAGFLSAFCPKLFKWLPA